MGWGWGLPGNLQTFPGQLLLGGPQKTDTLGRRWMRGSREAPSQVFSLPERPQDSGTPGGKGQAKTEPSTPIPGHWGWVRALKLIGGGAGRRHRRSSRWQPPKGTW